MTSQELKQLKQDILEEIQQSFKKLKTKEKPAEAKQEKPAEAKQEKPAEAEQQSVWPKRILKFAIFVLILGICVTIGFLIYKYAMFDKLNTQKQRLISDIAQANAVKSTTLARLPPLPESVRSEVNPLLTVTHTMHDSLYNRHDLFLLYPSLSTSRGFPDRKTAKRACEVRGATLATAEDLNRAAGGGLRSDAEWSDFGWVEKVLSANAVAGFDVARPYSNDRHVQYLTLDETVLPYTKYEVRSLKNFPNVQAMEASSLDAFPSVCKKIPV